MLAFLALFGLLSRGQAIPADFGPRWMALVAICHSGQGDPGYPGPPATDCDVCLLCQVVHGDQAGIALLPEQIALRLPLVVSIAVQGQPELYVNNGCDLGMPRARAPPSDI
jgi:hypothetical protein